MRCEVGKGDEACRNCRVHSLKCEFNHRKNSRPPCAPRQSPGRLIATCRPPVEQHHQGPPGIAQPQQAHHSGSRRADQFLLGHLAHSQTLTPGPFASGLPLGHGQGMGNLMPAQVNSVSTSAVPDWVPNPSPLPRVPLIGYSPLAAAMAGSNSLRVPPSSRSPPPPLPPTIALPRLSTQAVYMPSNGGGTAAGAVDSPYQCPGINFDVQRTHTATRSQNSFTPGQQQLYEPLYLGQEQTVFVGGLNLSGYDWSLLGDLEGKEFVLGGLDI
ncbi:hypothetical protein F5Y17DRAFT_35730 [Xylariaceae sp. FL0594]|nr:hypothetical protein F5Y17DRAFT_35730 [Xylariaceae sp. FL0594]